MSDIRITAGNSIVAIDSWLKSLAGNLTGSTVVGFRQTRVQFEDVLAQTVQAGAPDSPTTAAINPIQFSSGGTAIKATRTDFSQGSMTTTQRLTDLAISGNGFFVLSKVKNPTSMKDLVFTRNGSFNFELEPDNSIVSEADRRTKLGPNSQLGVLRLVSQEGLYVVGTTGDYAASGVTGVPGTPAPAPDASKSASSLGDLVKEPYRSAKSTGDMGLGGIALKCFSYPFIKDSNGNFGLNDDLLGQVAFNMNGMLLNANKQDVPDSTYSFESGGQVALGAAVTDPNSQNQLKGQITDVEKYNKYVSLMTFSSPDGLSRQAGTSFTWTNTAGPYFVGVAGTARGPVGANNEIMSGSLETSNSNVNTTLPELTIAQKSFTANVKIVSVGNSLIDDVNQLIK